MRLLAPLVVVAASAGVLVVPAAAEFPSSAEFRGTMKVAISAKAPGAPTIRRKTKTADTPLSLRGDLGSFTFLPSDKSLIGPLSAGAKPGRFDVLQPTGQAYTDLVASTQEFFAGAAGLVATVDGVEVRGTHAMKKDGATVSSAVLYTIAGTATDGGVQFTAKLKVKFKGRRALV